MEAKSPLALSSSRPSPKSVFFVAFAALLLFLFCHEYLFHKADYNGPHPFPSGTSTFFGTAPVPGARRRHERSADRRFTPGTRREPAAVPSRKPSRADTSTSVPPSFPPIKAQLSTNNTADVLTAQDHIAADSSPPLRNNNLRPTTPAKPNSLRHFPAGPIDPTDNQLTPAAEKSSPARNDSGVPKKETPDVPSPPSSRNRTESPGNPLAKRRPPLATPLPAPPPATPPTSAKCLPFLIYDKPPKTGSTAISDAIERYFASKGTPHKRCWNPHCLNRMQAICNGTRSPATVIGHTSGLGDRFRNQLFRCLKEKRFYAVTSIRKPPERWDSFYFYMVHKKKVDLFGMNYTTPYEEFMRRYPECYLLHYYDGLGAHCDGSASVEDRIKTIVSRYDEVVEHGEEPIQDFERRISKHIRVLNTAPRPNSYKTGNTDMSRLDNEWKLYKALRKLRNRPPNPTRVFC